jgi:cytochrome c-type biogenesis protein CcmH
MIVFWIVVGALSAGVAGLILSRAARAQDLDAAAADATLSLYRRQLAEIDELAARGLIAADERRGAHAEAARRLLGAAEGGDKAGWVVGAKDRRIVLMVAAAAPLGALALYLAVGAPGYADQPYLERLAAWRSAAPSELDAPQMAAVLRAVTTERPDDPEPYRFLAIAEMASGDSAAAVRALREAITRAPERADLWESLGEALMMQAQGEVTPGAARAYEEALARDPAAATARFHLARRQIEAGETEAGLAAWRALRSELPAEDPRRQVLSAAIAEVEAGPRPAPANMPDATAIQAMVDGLAARLAVEPDNPQGWVRLVRSYAVLGQAAARDAALSQARRRYADDPALLQQLTEAARTEPLR